ncbi:MAG: gas vesicle protein K [Acidobacteria bacterium]|nr:gas vesicle protein K [Acidobacteriota bacterium]
MNSMEEARVESENMSDFARVMEGGDLSLPRHLPKAPAQTARINLDPQDVKSGLGRLVLTLVKLLHELLERQAIRRIDAGSLSDEQIEGLGLTLMRQAQEIENLRKQFGLEDDDLNLDLGPLGTLLE